MAPLYDFASMVQGHWKCGGRKPFLTGRIGEIFVEEAGFKEFRVTKDKFEKVGLCSGNKEESGLMKMYSSLWGWGGVGRRK